MNRHFKHAQLTTNRHKSARGNTVTKPNTYSVSGVTADVGNWNSCWN